MGRIRLGDGDDTRSGTPENDIIVSGKGNDVIHSLAGDDIVRDDGGSNTRYASTILVEICGNTCERSV